VKFPALYEAAEHVSAESQKVFLLVLRGELAALAVGALVGQLPAKKLGGSGPILAFVLFGVALALRVSRIGERAQRRWYDARAAAESIKSASWQYAVGGEAYRLGDTTARPRFQGDLPGYIRQLTHLDVPAEDSAEAGVTADMEHLRGQPTTARAAAYLAHRVKDQRGWYARNADKNKRLGRHWWRALVATEAAALLVGLGRIIGQFDVDWLGVLATVAAGLAAWQQAKRYTELSESYSVTTHEVALIEASLDSAASESEWAQFVHDAEAAFSREHTLWLARRQGPLA
jgi:hypothetical protein